MKEQNIKIYLILNALFLVIIFILLGFLFNNIFSLTPYLHNIEPNGHQSIQIIISRFNEDLKWTLSYPFNKYKYIVYNKNPDNDDYEKQNVIKTIDIKNQGKCDHTYLYHVVHNYDSLKDITNLFL